MKICLDLHDFSVVNNRLDLLLKLKEKYPNFKVSLFTVPMDEECDWGPYTIRKNLLKEVKRCLDWIQIIPHGYFHIRHEMKDVGYEYFKDFILPNIERAFERDGLPYERGFCGPHWTWTPGIVRALDDLGWWGAVDPRQLNMATPKNFYRYSYCIDEEFPEQDVLKLHGHIYGTKNDLGRCMDNLFKLPTSVEWCFVTEFLEDNNAYQGE